MPRSSSVSQRFFLGFHTYMKETFASYPPPQHRVSPLRASLTSFDTRTFTTSQHQQAASSPRVPSFYELFPSSLPAGPPPGGPFTPDQRRLRTEYLQIQAKAHPDLHQGANRARAEGYSSLVNEAYKTLSSPLLRAQYLLSLQGIHVAEDETAKVEDPELLMEVLEIREQLEEAQGQEQIDEMIKDNSEKIKESVNKLEKYFAEAEVQKAISETTKLRYLVNIEDSLRQWEKGKPIVLEH